MAGRPQFDHKTARPQRNLSAGPTLGENAMVRTSEDIAGRDRQPAPNALISGRATGHAMIGESGR
jgi:hypothetical protein